MHGYNDYMMKWTRRCAKHRVMIKMIIHTYVNFCMTNSSKDPDSKVHGANMRPSWGRQDPDGPHVGPMNFALWGHKCVALFSVIIDWFYVSDLIHK